MTVCLHYLGTSLPLVHRALQRGQAFHLKEIDTEPDVWLYCMPLPVSLELKVYSDFKVAVI